jgi:hypothetical protein
MAAQQLGQRPVQVTVWGATGFTGRLVCEHLVQNYQVGGGGAGTVEDGGWHRSCCCSPTHRAHQQQQ